jgi:hypothetical protein
MVGAAFAILAGAASISLLPWTFVSVPDFTAVERFADVCRSIVSR